MRCTLPPVSAAVMAARSGKLASQQLCMHHNWQQQRLQAGWPGWQAG
jgi:hypothetical protein